MYKLDTAKYTLYNVLVMKNLFLPTKANNYTPKLLTHKFITIYTFLLLTFNVLTSDIQIFAAIADVDSKSILALHNEERLDNGLGSLTLNSKLNNSAKAKAIAMMAADCWDHYCPNEKSPWDFIDEAGYEYVYAGENLAEGFSDNEKVFDAWMNSKTHRENILRADFNEIGIAIEYGEFQGIKNNALIVVHFGNTSTYKTPSTENDVSVSKQLDKSTAISSPGDGAILNTNTPTVQGESKNGEIKIYNYDDYVSSTSADEGIFTYRFPVEHALPDGNQLIKAEHATNLTSDQVNIIIDTVSPEIDSIILDSVLKTEKQNLVVIGLEGSDDIEQITTSIETIATERARDGNWKLHIDYEVFKDISELEVTIYDKAGNSTEKTINVSSIKGIANNKIMDFSDPESRLIFGIDKVGLRRSINLVFALFIMALIVIDYLALTRMSLETSVAKKHLGHHFSIFALLVFIALAGGTTGELLEGVNS
ncbi:hypothetical protein GF389_04270 [Candidatus Dojkabacteria bacterium]|nr:hypothetical protein [Candidatus Dojkabacteria bacterium]